MERAAARVAVAQEPLRRQSYNLAARKQLPEHAECRVLRRRPVDGHRDRAVGDDEIHMGGGGRAASRVAVEAHARNADDFELAPARIAGLVQGPGDGVQHIRVRVFRASGRLADNHARGNEAREIVDMAVGVVVGQPLADPDHLLRAECLGQRRLRVLLRPAIAVGVEQRLRRGENGALAVMLDGAALQHEIELPLRHARKLGDLAAHEGIVRHVEFAAPSVGLEAHGHGLAARPREDRAGVPEPDIAVSGLMNLCRAAEPLARRFPGLRAVHEQPHQAAIRQRANKRRHVAAWRFQIAVPFAGYGGPCRPHGLLRRPFGRDFDRFGHFHPPDAEVLKPKIVS